MSETTRELHFSVDGAFIMDLARDGYWFENRQLWAIKLLGTLQGITVDQAMKVLNGDAVLSGVASDKSTIEYSETPDTEFKAKVARHLAYLKGKADQEAREREKEREENERKTILREQGFGALRDFIASEREAKPITDPIELGVFTVSKTILDDYVETYVEHEFEPITAASVLAGNNVKLMKLHKQLRESVGLSGYWGIQAGNEPDEFDKELQKIAWAAVEKDKRTFQRKRLLRAGVDPSSIARDGIASD